MVGIEEYPDLEGLENNFVGAIEEAIEELADEIPELAPLFNNLVVTEATVLGDWGRGNAVKGEDDLEIGFHIDLEQGEEIGINQPLSEFERFDDLRNEIIDRVIPNLNADETILEWFNAPRVSILPDSAYEDSIKGIIRQAQPNRLYDLRRKSVITIENGEINRSSADGSDTVVVDEGEEDILQFPDVQDIRDALNQSFEDAKAVISDGAGSDEIQVISALFIERYIVVGAWGAGGAVKGEDQLQVLASVDMEGADPKSVAVFSRVVNQLDDTMEDVLEPTPEMAEWFEGISINGVRVDLMNSTIGANLRGSAQGRVVDLTNGDVISLEDGDVITRSVIEEEPEPEPITPEEEAQIELDELQEQFPDVPVELLQFADDQKRLGVVAEIPAGKTTKAVEPREAYPFEKELFTPGPSDDFNREIQEGIGNSMATQAFGVDDPASSFPRTGTYIKWYLLEEGPAYGLELYNNLVVYSGYISSLYDGLFKAGSYESMRQMLYRLERYSEMEENQTLIKPIPPNEAVGMGLDITPKLPTGEEAPWLENRQYYAINPDSVDNPAWDNITKELFGDE